MVWGKAWWQGLVLGFWFIGKSRRKTNMVFPLFFFFSLSLLYCSLFLCMFLTFSFLFLFSSIHPFLYRLIFFPPMYPPFYSLFSHISSPCKNFHTFLIVSPFFFFPYSCLSLTPSSTIIMLTKLFNYFSFSFIIFFKIFYFFENTSI